MSAEEALYALDPAPQIYITYGELNKWYKGYDQGLIAKNFKPGGNQYWRVKDLQEAGISIQGNFLEYAYLRHNTVPSEIIKVTDKVFTQANQVATACLVLFQTGQGTQGTGLTCPAQSDPGLAYTETDNITLISRYYENGVLYIKDKQTNQEYWNIPTATDGALEVTKFSTGLITTVTYTADGQLDTTNPASVSLDASASADVKAAFDAWVAAGNDPSNVNPADLHLDQTAGGVTTLLDSRLFSWAGGEYSNNAVLIGESPASGTGGDMLRGGIGNDLLIGSSGADVLYGGGGNDAMAGGAGDDTYILDGSGQITIEDKIGNNKVFLNGRELGVLIRQADGTFKSADGKISGSLQGGDLILVDDTGAQVTLNKNFTEGDFGIYFQDAPPPNPEVPTMPATTRDIMGDLAPAEFTATLAVGTAIDPGWKWTILDTQANTHDEPRTDANGDTYYITITDSYTYTYNQRDDLDNWITGAAEPDRADSLYGSSGNDHIMGLGGNDSINAMQGGDDFIETGDGNNVVSSGAGNDIIIGGGGNDRIYAGEGLNYVVAGDGDNGVEAGAGNDYLQTGKGDDFIRAGDGDNYAEAGAGRDWVYGGTGKDLFIGGADGDIMDGADGNDQLYGEAQVTTEQAIADGNIGMGTGMQGDWLNGGSGDDIVVGSAGNDVLMGAGGRDLLIAGAGDDEIMGDTDWLTNSVDWTVTDVNGVRTFEPVYGTDKPADAAADTIYAGSGNDHVWAGAGDDVVYGEDGNDALSGNGGNDILFGGVGDDNISGDGIEHAGDTVVNEGDDYLDGGAGNDELSGQGGNDVLAGGTGDDTLWGGEGDDHLEGGEGIDTLWGGNGSDTLIGDAGDDKLYGEAGDGNLLDGGDGNDLLNTGGTGNTLLGGAGDDTLEAIGGSSYLDGGAGTDSLTATDGNNELFGGAGNDNLQATGGNNYLDGGDGNNQIVTNGAGGNTLIGGIGDDTLSAQGGNNLLDAGEGSNMVIADGGDNSLFAGGGDDTLSAGGGNNYLDAGDGTNTLIADGGFNTLYAGSGNDYLSAAGGNNYLDGGDGVDQLVADGGNNTLIGGAGDDVLVASGGGNLLDGGEGRDLYVFEAGFGTDHIADAGVGGNTVQFNFGFGGSGIVLGLGSLKLSFANGDELHIDGFDPNDPINSCSIDTFIFADRSFTLQQLLDEASPVIEGTPGADILQGTAMGERLNGLAGNDTISGAGGYDTIDGGTGADTMSGGMGNDRYYVDNQGDVVVENAFEGIDTVLSSVGAYTLTDNVENLTLLGLSSYEGLGNALDNTITGNNNDNYLNGGDGADTLVDNGGNDFLDGGAGADSMTAGAGDDTYYVDNAGDVVVENFGEGYDTVVSCLGDYSLAANVEKLNLSGSADINGSGNALNNYIGGNSGNNVLDGAAGNDRVDGGAGADTMLGGAGDDVFFVENVNDEVIENANEGLDSVSSSISYVLSENVENLSLTGNNSIDGSGNAQDNVIYGNNSSNVLFGDAGNDTLNGLDGADTLNGGAGADVMNGGYGNDVYFVDDAGDQAIESALGKTYQNYYGGSYIVTDIDTVKSSISYTLGTNLENLTLLGIENIDGTGNALNNVITGNGGDNVLIGDAGSDTLDGGAGADTLIGGAGSDIYYIDNINDQIIDDVAGQSFTRYQWVWTGYNYQYLPYTYVQPDYEQVYSSVDFELSANLENLTLTGIDSINGIGNELNNQLTGNDADNILVGGAGNDTFYGMGGIDTLDGGAGDDAYSITDTGDIIIEQAGNGYDRVFATTDYTLSANIEELTLEGEAISGTGNETDNQIFGNILDNVIDGSAGNDHLNGQGGNDTIFGGEGNDEIIGGWDDYVRDENWNWSLAPNSDFLDGGNGNDHVDGGSGADSIMGGAGDDVLFGGHDDGGEGGDPLLNNDYIDGGEGDDQIDGGSGADILLGGAGNDYLYGGDDGWASTYYDYVTQDFLDASSDDYLDGGLGDDWLEGGSGNDTLIGGAGWDELYGGDGNDVIFGTRFEDVTSVYGQQPEQPADLITVSSAEGDDAIGSANVLSGANNYLLNGVIGDGQYANLATDSGWDHDFYKIALTAGSSISISTFSDIDTVIGLYDANGNLLIENDDADGAGGSWNSLDSSFTFYVDVDGEYSLAITSYDNWLPSDPFNPSLNGTAGQSLGGGAYEATVSISSTNQFGNGLDYIEGGTGDDTYVVGGTYIKVDDWVVNECGDSIQTQALLWTTDEVVEFADQGYDVVQTFSSFVLDENIEELQLIFDPNTAALDTQYYADMIQYGQDGTGNDLDNVIIGNELNNRLDGGLGADYLEGGAGNDTYVVDQIGDVIVEEANAGIDTVESFIDYSLNGTNLENLTLLDGAISGEGNDADNIIQGNAGYNELYGGTGNDILIANGGDDSLYGGAGNDRYVFRPGDGEVWIFDSEGLDTLFIGGDLTVADIETGRSGDDLVLTVAGTPDQVVIVNWFTQAEGIGRIEFCDASALDRAEMEAMFNAPPVAVADSIVTNEDVAQTEISAAMLLANDTDPNAGDILRLNGFDAVTANGNAVTQDANGNLVLSLVNDYQSLGVGQSASDSFTYTIADAAGETSTATVDVTITGTNDAPVVATAIADQSTLQDAPFSFTVPADSFQDIDTGDLLTYSATLADGSALPAWLTFDAATQTFSGIPDNWDVAMLDVQVVATDLAGASATSTFVLDVQNVNDTPTANADTGLAVEDGGSVQLDATSLLANDTDPDFIYGDTLSITGVSQAASGAAVSLVNGAVQYDVGNLYQSLAQGQTTTDTFSYTVTDTAGAISTAEVTMTITGVNDGPVTADDQAAVQEDLSIAATGNVLSNDSDIDQGTVLQVANAGTQQGQYGSLVLNADGSYNYVLDNNTQAVQSLAQGQTVTEQFAYQATDGIASTPATLTVTITGTNDAPVTEIDTAAVQEDGAITAGGNVLINDTDVDQGSVLSVANAGVFVGQFGTLTLNADGSYEYVLDNASYDVQSLAEGQVVTDTFDYAATDGITSTPSTLTVSITGTNDAPVVVADVNAVQEDVTLTATGNVLSNDSDIDQGTVLQVANAGIFVGQFGTLTINADGSYSYALDNASLGVQSLAQGQVVTDTFDYAATDGITSTPSTLTVSITGTNDAPVVAADVNAVQEDVVISATGNVLANDSDIDQGTVLQVANAGVFVGQFGTLTLNADGSYSYALDNASYGVQSLAQGQVVTDAFDYAATDGITSTPSTLTVSITGTNDAPVVVADVNAVQEDVTLTATGNVLSNDSDIDQGTVLQVANAGIFVGQFGTLTLNADGSYSYALDNASLGVQSLAQGQVVTDTFDYAATDGITSTPSTLTVSITGTNDAPVVAADVNAVQEDVVISATGNVLANDSDIDQGTVLQVANAGVFVGQFGTLTLNADGSYSYALDNASLGVQSLAQGQVVIDTFDYAATDGITAPPSTLTVSITGTNDAPVVVADVNAVQEDVTFTATGNVLANDSDIDQGTVLQVANVGVFVGQFGTLTLNADGSYSYALDNASLGVQSLAQGQVVTDTFDYAATDGITATPSTLTVSITGTNDAPVVVADVNAVQEDVTLTATGNVLANDNDIDQGTVLQVASAGVFVGQFGTLTLNADGSYSYALDNASCGVQSLAQGQVVTDTFDYAATDGITSTPSTLTVSITGTNDAPVVVADVNAVQEDVVISAAGNVLANDSDIDQGTVLQVANTGVFVGQFGTLTLNADGSYSYALDNGSYGVQSLAQGQVVTDTFDYAATDGITSTPSTLTVSITGTNDAPIVAVPLTDASTLEDQTFSYRVPDGTFTDIDQGDVLSYQAAMADGSALPDWLKFDAATQTFSGIPSNWDVGLLDVAVTATDLQGATATSTFSLDVQNVNDAPVVLAHMADQRVDNGKRFSIAIPAGTFDDWDIVHGDSLSYSATLANGEELPEWLNFDAATGTFSGRAKGSDSYDILLTATDQAGASVSQVFTFSAGKDDQDEHRDDEHDDNERHDNEHDDDEHDYHATPDTTQDEIIVSSSVNDIIHTGNGADSILFGRGDGQDTVYGGEGTDNTLILTDGIQMTDIALTRNANDLILEAGSADQITLRSWYDTSANFKSVLTLDIISQAVTEFDEKSKRKSEHKSDHQEIKTTLDQYDFSAVVAAFDQAWAADSTIQHWNAAQTLATAHVDDGDDAALGSSAFKDMSISSLMALGQANQNLNTMQLNQDRARG
ncbi:hypothetical protein TK5_25910 [Sideroxyarcus sp. TK5]